jgi:hypothetical protein
MIGLKTRNFILQGNNKNLLLGYGVPNHWAHLNTHSLSSQNRK